MTAHRGKTVTRLLTWRGRLIQVRFDANWLRHDRIAHLTLTTLDPPQGPLPVTETGYRSHFTDRQTIESAGGPAAFAAAWLDSAARSRSWLAIEDAARQLSLL